MEVSECFTSQPMRRPAGAVNIDEIYRFSRVSLSLSLYSAFDRPLTAIPSTESIFGTECSATRSLSAAACVEAAGVSRPPAPQHRIAAPPGPVSWNPGTERYR